MGVRTFARIKHLIWDQLLASEADIIQESGMFALFLFTFKGNTQCAKKVLRLAMEYADSDKCKIVYSSPEAINLF